MSRYLFGCKGDSVSAVTVLSSFSVLFFFFSSRRRHTRCLSDWSSDVCSSDLPGGDLFLIVYVAREKKLYALNASGKAPSGQTLARMNSLGYQWNSKDWGPG